ncbi:hypothetical protein [Heyndrickxia camelliae]|uniref:Uncharacterized protein n=1 Tax=Heyndrickxia camelliae TaxID=1707093 RepID=A0A2N3LLC5_9BACI|nr:hypothetical protein [Heyndrickxia camelliae]PKR85339.1 hypothetical protein CWO92_09090 [Heyndrickxia camelliae]
MKRYISSIVIVAVLLLTLSTFYIYSAVSASPFPHFKIEKESGDAKEIRTLQITGGYGLGNGHENFNLSWNGTVYSSEVSFLDRFNNGTKRMKELRKQYKNFMRGKMEENSFYQDKVWLIYADTSSNWSGSTKNPYLEISLLKKKDKKNTKIHIPLSKQNHYVTVDDVQLVGKQLKIATQNTVASKENDFNEIHVYTVDITNQKLVKDETIQPGVSNQRLQKNTYINIQNLQDTNISDPSKYVLYNISLMKTTSRGRDQILNRELIAYNTETSKKELIKLPKTINIEELVSFHGDVIYFVTMNPNELKLTAYNFINQRVENEFSINRQNADTSIYAIKNEKLYLCIPYLQGKTAGVLNVYDVKTSKKLFQGNIVNVEKYKKWNRLSLDFYDMEID